MRLTTLCPAFFLSLDCNLITVDTAEPESQYQILEWEGLVPTGWEPPLVPVAHDQVEKAGIDPDSVVGDLAGKLIALPGFMKPLVFEGNSLSAFLLVPYLQHHITQHAHLHAKQMVHVSLLESIRRIKGLWGKKHSSSIPMRYMNLSGNDHRT